MTTKIIHCCLANVYNEGHSYQENILPKFHKAIGLDVSIVASTETVNNRNEIIYIKPTEYVNTNNIRVTRLPYSRVLPNWFKRKIRCYKGLYEYLVKLKPDVIFLHDVQFFDVFKIRRYARKYKVKIYADCHTDYMNSARTVVSKYILHAIIYKWFTKVIEPYVTKFWGVTPSRRDFLVEFYGVKKEKVDLLVMGVDDTLVEMNRKEAIRLETRKKYYYDQDDFILICGGKIVKRKNIHLLMEAVNKIESNNIKLLIFGSVGDEVSDLFGSLLFHDRIKFVGWKSELEIYHLFIAADLAIFPGTHSVLWEQAVGLGLPAVFKYWNGYNHLDYGGNCRFISTVTIDSIKQEILMIFNNNEMYKKMKSIAENIAAPNFYYTNIAKKSIDL